MAKKKLLKSRKSKKDWLVTYSDMMTLLLVFFIAIFNNSETNELKTRVIFSTFNGNIGLLQGGKTLESDDNFVNYGKIVESLSSSKSDRNLDSKSQNALAPFSLFEENKKIRLVENESGIIISLFSDVFFDQGSARVKYQAIHDVLQNINILLTSDNFTGNILIEGHTDNVPYRGDEFKDNWELSMARALSVMNAIRSYPFIKPIDEKKVSIHAYGDTRPIEDNDKPFQRAYNRRVDIVLKR